MLPALTHAAINAYPLLWNTAVYLLPESARGLHLQITVTIVLVVLAIVLILLTGPLTFAAARRKWWDGVQFPMADVLLQTKLYRPTRCLA